jgi:hypothetical protein
MNVLLFLLGGFVVFLLVWFAVIWLSVSAGRKLEFVTYEGEPRTIVVYYVPRWWIFWPKGRSMTLWLPFIGKFAAVDPSDANTALKKKLTLRHEYVHYIRVGKHPILWYLKYVLIPGFRFGEEVAAYRESVKSRIEDGVMVMIVDGNQVEVAAYYANAISTQYFLPPKYDFLTSYFELLKG